MFIYFILFLFSKRWAQFPVKLTEPITSILYITADKQHMEELKHAIHVREIAEGKQSFLSLQVHNRLDGNFNLALSFSSNFI